MKNFLKECLWFAILVHLLSINAKIWIHIFELKMLVNLSYFELTYYSSLFATSSYIYKAIEKLNKQ